MSQLSFLSGKERSWSVSELTRYLRQLVESDYVMTRPDTRIVAKDWFEANVPANERVVVDM